MKTSFTALVIAALGVGQCQCLPHVVPRAAAIDDSTVLNFALTLEHLENAFYTEALGKFDEKAFTDAGLPGYARGRFVQVGEHEAAHVAFLSGALGDKATKPCKYSFPYTDPKSFAALSQVLEGVGVSAYAGAAQFITNKDYLTAAAVVLSTEARHASWVASAVNKFAGWSGALDVPLGLNQVFTLAAPFIVPGSCPSTNPALPVKAFPSVKFGSGGPGATVSVEFDASKDKALFAVFYTGLSQVVAPIKDGQVTIPSELRGQVYAVVSTNGTQASDDNIVAGPAILLFEFDSQGKLI